MKTLSKQAFRYKEQDADYSVTVTYCVHCDTKTQITTPKTKRVLSYTKPKNNHENHQRLRYTKFEICIKTKLLNDVKMTIKLPNCLAYVSAYMKI